jgi:hypothetical protein
VLSLVVSDIICGVMWSDGWRLDEDNGRGLGDFDDWGLGGLGGGDDCSVVSSSESLNSFCKF